LDEETKTADDPVQNELLNGKEKGMENDYETLNGLFAVCLNTWRAIQALAHRRQGLKKTAAE
jgi:hypothetical protein